METWWSEKPAQEYDKYMRRVLDRIIETGAVPIIATKADNLEGDHSINATIAQIAYEYDIPLWNFWARFGLYPTMAPAPIAFTPLSRNFFDDRSDEKRMASAISPLCKHWMRQRGLTNSPWAVKGEPNSTQFDVYLTLW
jgi:hypothetical protein